MSDNILDKIADAASAAKQEVTETVAAAVDKIGDVAESRER